MKPEISQETTVQELAAIVYSHLEKNGIRAFLVGGSVVSIYTDNKYESMDLDFISPNDHKQILEVMSLINFKPDPKNRKNLRHPECEITVEFPGSTLIIGGQQEKTDHVEKVNGINVRMLSPTQSVMDRIAAFIAWADIQGLDQAQWICEKQPVDFEKIKKWAKKEGATADQLSRIIAACEKGIRKLNNEK